MVTYKIILKKVIGLEYKEGKTNLLTIVPLLILVCIAPLIVYIKIVLLEGVFFEYWTGIKEMRDYFSYNKMLCILLCTGTAAITFISALLKKKIHIKKVHMYVPMGIYALLIILSTIFSEYKNVALYGFVQRYEGMLVLLSYIVILFIVINLIDDEKKIKFILGALMISAAIIGTIGIFQYFGLDLFTTDFGRKLILGSKYDMLAHKLKFILPKKTIYSTLYHYNYVGSYMAMLFPLTFTLALLIKDKVAKFSIGILSFLMFANWIACNSRGGFLGGLLAIIILIIMLRKYIIKKWKFILGTFLIFLLILVGFNKTASGQISKRLSSAFKDAAMLFKEGSQPIIDDVRIEGNQIIFTDSEGTLKIQNNKNDISFKDSDNNEIKVNVDGKGGMTLEDSRYKDYTVYLGSMRWEKEKYRRVEVHKKNVKLEFIVISNNFRFVNHNREVVNLKPVEHWGFEGKEKLGSARGYIWSRSIPLLKKTILLGYGPDTFTIYFPQHDYIGKIKAYGTMNMIVDKPHNLYLQIALSTGIVSLIAVIALFIMYFIASIKLYFRNDFSDFYSIVGLGIFVAVIGYLGAGFFNDSVVSVAPVFWVLLGVGVSINKKLASMDK